MNPDQFGRQSRGTLTPITTLWRTDYCFNPAPLPPRWEFSAELWPQLKEASSALNRLEGIGRTLPNPMIILRPARDREAIRSSEIEGTYATPRELLLFELDPRESHSEGDSANQRLEVLNYARALDHAANSDLPLCLRLIRDLHRILMTGVRGKDRSPGEFRQVAVAIGSRGKFVPPPHERLMEFLGPFESYLNEKDSPFDPLVDCFLAHYQFEAIHPFTDGNGRVGRLLLSIMVQRVCGLSKPWVHMSEYFEAHREEYYQGLFRISTEGAWTQWIDYCLRGVAAQAQATITRCEQLLHVKESYRQRLTLLSRPERLRTIVDGVFDSPLVRVADLPERLGVTYPTAKADVERLVQAGILKELPDRYPKTYYAPDVYRVAYEGLE